MVIASFDRAETAHACVVTRNFEPPRYFLATLDIFFLRPKTLDLSFQKAYLSKHFLISRMVYDVILRSFCSVATFMP